MCARAAVHRRASSFRAPQSRRPAASPVPAAGAPPPFPAFLPRPLNFPPPIVRHVLQPRTVLRARRGGAYREAGRDALHAFSGYIQRPLQLFRSPLSGSPNGLREIAAAGLKRACPPSPQPLPQKRRFWMLLVLPLVPAAADKAGVAAVIAGPPASSEVEKGENGENGCCTCRPVLGSIFSLLHSSLHSARPLLPPPPPPPPAPPSLPSLSGRRHKLGAIGSACCCRSSYCLLRFFGELRRVELGASPTVRAGLAAVVAPEFRRHPSRTKRQRQPR